MIKLTIIILLLSLLVGCQPVIEVKEYEPVFTPEEIITLPEVEFVPLEYSVSNGSEVILAPSLIECARVKAGVKLDTWTTNGVVEIGQNVITYKKGDQWCLYIVNDNGREVTYKLEYLDARKDVVFLDKNDGNGYARAPYITRAWVRFPKEVIVPDKSVAKVPVIIVIPKDAKVPDTWAFRIGVDMAVTDFTHYSATTYFLMKK